MAVSEARHPHHSVTDGSFRLTITKHALLLRLRIEQSTSCRTVSSEAEPRTRYTLTGPSEPRCTAIPPPNRRKNAGGSASWGITIWGALSESRDTVKTAAAPLSPGGLRFPCHRKYANRSRPGALCRDGAPFNPRTEKKQPNFQK